MFGKSIGKNIKNEVSTNNSLEGSNSQIKTKLSNHRGMETPQQVTFIFWMLTFQRVKNHQELKELMDIIFEQRELELIFNKFSNKPEGQIKPYKELL